MCVCVRVSLRGCLSFKIYSYANVNIYLRVLACVESRPTHVLFMDETTGRISIVDALNLAPPEHVCAQSTQ